VRREIDGRRLANPACVVEVMSKGVDRTSSSARTVSMACGTSRPTRWAAPASARRRADAGRASGRRAGGDGRCRIRASGHPGRRRRRAGRDRVCGRTFWAYPRAGAVLGHACRPAPRGMSVGHTRGARRPAGRGSGAALGHGRDRLAVGRRLGPGSRRVRAHGAACLHAARGGRADARRRRSRRPRPAAAHLGPYRRGASSRPSSGGRGRRPVFGRAHSGRALPGA